MHKCIDECRSYAIAHCIYLYFMCELSLYVRQDNAWSTKCDMLSTENGIAHLSQLFEHMNGCLLWVATLLQCMPDGVHFHPSYTWRETMIARPVQEMHYEDWESTGSLLYHRTWIDTTMETCHCIIQDLYVGFLPSMSWFKWNLLQDVCTYWTQNKENRRQQYSVDLT